MAEVLYHTHEDLHGGAPVMSERVESLASGIYREFECMIGTYGEGVIKNLMPQVVQILESLSEALRERQEQEVELELLREENCGLRAQGEKEKQLRKMTEQKYLETEDGAEEERKRHAKRVEALEACVRRLEVKIRNAQDQLLRQDERKEEMKAEYSKLHARYTDIFRSHAEYVEKVKHQMDRPGFGTSPRHGVTINLRHVADSTGTPPTESAVISQLGDTSTADRAIISSVNEQSASGALTVETSDQIGDVVENQCPSKLSEDDAHAVDGNAGSNSAIVEQKGPGVDSTDAKSSFFPATDAESRDQETSCLQHVEDWVATPEDSSLEIIVPDYMGHTGNIATSRDHGFEEEFEASELPMDPVGVTLLTNSSSVFAELADCYHGALTEIDNGADLSVMSAEVEKIIAENSKLLETKNALNIVKDDLIARLDELSGEQELLRQELEAAQLARDRADARSAELEEELRKGRAELEEIRVGVASASENRFSRVDMARVIMERNSFKEKLMELQEAVRYAELVRAAREHPDVPQRKKPSGFWDFFSNLIGSDDSEDKKPQQRRKSSKKETT